MSRGSFCSWVRPSFSSTEFKSLHLDRKNYFERSVSSKSQNLWTYYKCDELNERCRHATLSCQPGEFSPASLCTPQHYSDPLPKPQETETVTKSRITKSSRQGWYMVSESLVYRQSVVYRPFSSAAAHSVFIRLYEI